MTKTVAFSIAAFFAVALLGSPAAAAENVTEREVHDRAQIEKLMWQYVRALDTENAMLMPPYSHRMVGSAVAPAR